METKKRRTTIQNLIAGACILGIGVGQAFALDIYWTTGLGGTIQAANFDGSGTTTLVTFGTTMRGIGLLPSANKLYVAGNDRIMYADLDGSNFNQFYVTGLGASAPQGVAVDRVNSRIYFSSLDGISRIDSTTGTGVATTLVTSQGAGSEAIALDVANQHIYYLEESDNSLRRINYDGTGQTTLVTGGNIFNPEGISVDTVNQRIYVVNQGGGSSGNIVRYDFAGTFIDTVTSSVATDGPEGVVVDNTNNKIYFTANNTRGQIRSANLDGSALDNSFITNLNTDVQQVAVIPEPSTYALIFGGLGLGLALLLRSRKKAVLKP